MQEVIILSEEEARELTREMIRTLSEGGRNRMREILRPRMDEGLAIEDAFIALGIELGFIVEDDDGYSFDAEKLREHRRRLLS